MLAWHVPFFGWRRLPADLSEFEIAHFISLKPVDIRAVHSTVQGEPASWRRASARFPDDV
jgi:hypothetical protein